MSLSLLYQMFFFFPEVSTKIFSVKKKIILFIPLKLPKINKNVKKILKIEII